MNRNFRISKLLLAMIFILCFSIFISTTKIFPQSKNDSSIPPDMFPVFCGRFIVFENKVPEQIIENRKDFDMGFFEQEINRFQAYVLANSTHDLMKQYETKYLGHEYILQDDKGNNRSVKIQKVVLMGTFCPHFGAHDAWQMKLDQSSDPEATKMLIAKEMWKDAKSGGVFIVGVTDSDLKSNIVFACTKTEKKIDVFKRKRVLYETRELIIAAFEKTSVSQSLNAFQQKEKGKIEKSEEFQGIEVQGKEFVFYFVNAWVDDGENPPWNSTGFKAGCCWEVRNNALVPVESLNVKHLGNKIFFDANNNNIPDYYSVEYLQYFKFVIDGQNALSISIPYYDCGM